MTRTERERIEAMRNVMEKKIATDKTIYAKTFAAALTWVLEGSA